MISSAMEINHVRTYPLDHQSSEEAIVGLHDLRTLWLRLAVFMALEYLASVASDTAECLDDRLHGRLHHRYQPPRKSP